MLIAKHSFSKFDKIVKIHLKSNPFALDNIILCGLEFEVIEDITIHVVLRKHFVTIF